MKNIVMHPATQARVDAVCQQLPHALLLSGLRGVGLSEIAEYIANRSQAKNTVSIIEPDEKGTISIDAIRSLYAQTRTKQQEQRIVIIRNADTMRQEAQNAFLKLLEEPSSSTSFILTTHSASKLLPTVHSRVQEIVVQPLTKQQTEDYLTELEINDEKIRAQIKFIASGLPAEINRLKQDEIYFQTQSETARSAKQLISGEDYQKLLIIQQYSSDRAKTLELLQHMLNIIEYSLSQKPNDRLAQQLSRLIATEAAIRENANTKIQLLQLVINK